MHLEHLWLGFNQITDAGMTMLVAALDAGRLPRLLNDQQVDKRYFLQENRASASAVQAAEDALAAACALDALDALDALAAAL